MPIRRGGVLKPMLIAVLVIVAVGVLWLCVEIYFALTATPNVDTDYASQMEELAASVQGEGENRWAEYSSILADHTLTLLTIEASIPGIADADDGALSLLRAGFDGALLQGAADRLRALRSADAVVVRPIPRDGMLIDVMLLTQFTESRPLAKSIRARMFLAAQRDDWAEYVETVADGLWLSRTVAAESLLINGLVGLGIHQVVIDGVRQQVLGGRVPAAALGELGELLASAPIPNAAHALRGELIWGLDSIQHTHDARGRLMLSRLPLLEGMDETSPAIVNLVSVVMPRRGTTERAFRDYFDVTIERSAMTPAERRASASEPFPNEVSGNPMLKLMSPALGLALRSFDSADVDRVGVQIMVAIERYRAEHDELPASLAELVPAFFDQFPSDPWAADAPLVYKLDDSDLGYTLYTVGFDGVDNGGTPAERAYDAFAPDADGTDFVFTAPGR